MAYFGQDTIPDKIAIGEGIDSFYLLVSGHYTDVWGEATPKRFYSMFPVPKRTEWETLAFPGGLVEDGV